MRFLDRIFRGFDPGEADKAKVMELLPKAQLVVADNVAEYYWRGVYNGDKNLVPEVSDFPNVMLPFETIFIEMRFPNWIEKRLTHVGILAQMKPRGGLPPKWYSDPHSAPFFEQGVKWHMLGHIFCLYQDTRPLLISQFGLPILEDGRVLPSFHPTGGIFYSLEYLRDFKGSDEENRRHHIAHFQIAVMPSFLTLSFMHCRNVRVRTEIPPPKLSKKHQKKTGQPLLRYHVLQIDHMKQVLETEGHASTEGLKKALHICRGHFATYGQDGKGLLFGKHAGTVWVPMHVRGSMDQGIVSKDYNVK